MLGEQEEDKFTKANERMRFISQLPLKLLLIFTGFILLLIGGLVFGNEAVRFVIYYFGLR
jgi:hypothetical protein